MPDVSISMPGNRKVGDKMECMKSASPGYKEGSVYVVCEDVAGVLGLMGDDGYFDPLSLLVSSFRKL